MNKATQKVVCTSFEKGKVHDFRILKESKTRFAEQTSVLADSGYQGLQKLHGKTQLPYKRKAKQKLPPEHRKHNTELASNRALNENVIGALKRFRIIADRYRNRRRRFGLRVNLIAAIYNMKLTYNL